MNIRSDSWHYRRYLAWQARGGNRPSTLTLCHYFWVVVFFSTWRWLLYTTRINRLHVSEEVAGWALGIGLAGMMGTGLALMAYGIYKNPWVALYLLGVIAGAVVAVALVSAIAFFVSDRWGQNIKESAVLVGAFAKAKKNRFCPILVVS